MLPQLLSLLDFLKSISTPRDEHNANFKFTELNDGTRVVCLPKQNQCTDSIKLIKSKIVSKLNTTYTYPPKVVQVIGDSSSTFSPSGTLRCQKLLTKALTEYSNCYVLWGLTGLSDTDGGKDVNAIVNACIEGLQNDTRYPIIGTIACVTDIGTVSALKQGYSAPSAPLSYILFVYNGANFGDDISTTDALADITVCFEGGIQSWCQLVNVLVHGGTVVVFTNGFRRDSGTVKRFSAAKFMNDVRSTAGDMVDISQTYISQFSSLNETSVRKFREATKALAESENSWKDRIRCVEA